MRKIQKFSFLLFIISALVFNSCNTNNDVTSITVNKTDIILGLGEIDSVQLTVKVNGDLDIISINHTNTNPSIISVEESVIGTSKSNSVSGSAFTKTYLITGTEVGTTVLTFKSGGKSYSCNITIEDTALEVSELTLDIPNFNLTIGEVDSVIVTLSYTGNFNSSAIEFNIANEAIIEVQEGEINEETTETDENLIISKTYIITASAVGTTKLIFQSGELKDSCEISVTDQISPAFTQGDLWFWGDAYETELSNNFTLYLGTDGINMEDLSGDGEVLFLELNTDLSITDSIPSGTYEMTELDASTFSPFTLVPAFVDGDDLWGTWYFGKTTNDIVSGNAVVSIENNIYKIVYTLVDYFGNTISGTYNGAITYYDTTQDNIKSSIKNVSKTNKDRQKIQLRRKLK